MNHLSDGGGPSLRPVILVADDTHDSRQLLCSMLRRFTRAEVVEACDGDQALALFDAKKPCLTFLDIDMPHKDGLEVLRTIRGTDAKAMVIMVTGIGSAPNVKASLEHGASGFVVKPYSAKRIIDSLARYDKQSGQQSLVLTDM